MLMENPALELHLHTGPGLLQPTAKSLAPVQLDTSAGPTAPVLSRLSLGDGQLVPNSSRPQPELLKSRPGPAFCSFTPLSVPVTKLRPERHSQAGVPGPQQEARTAPGSPDECTLLQELPAEVQRDVLTVHHTCKNRAGQSFPMPVAPQPLPKSPCSYLALCLTSWLYVSHR